ncbi:hypothetical protein BGX28_004431 [Mortierella sp. GBA30]|nr:hypothetical protein BGX28_004431 [Mortierella sp. GBA30]
MEAIESSECSPLAADRAFSLPEIRRLLSYFITKGRDVLACMLVNNDWYRTFSTGPLWHTTTLYCSRGPTVRNPTVDQFIKNSVYIRHLVIMDIFSIRENILVLLQEYTTAATFAYTDDLNLRLNREGTISRVNNRQTVPHLLSLSIGRQFDFNASLRLYPGSNVSRIDKLLTALVQRNSATLQRIELSRLTPVAPVGPEFWTAVAALPRLKQFVVNECMVMKGCIQSFLQSCSHLTELSLLNLKFIKSDVDTLALQAFHKTPQIPWDLPPNLERLKITNLGDIPPDVQLKGIIARCRGLKQLEWHLVQERSSREYAEQLKNFLVWERGLPELEGLNFPHSGWSDEDLVTIIQALTHTSGSSTMSFGCLSFFDCASTTITAPVHTSLPAAPSSGSAGIVVFCVRDSGFGLSALEALEPHFSSLADLDLRECPAATSPMLQLILETMENLRQFRADMIARIDILQGYDWVCNRLVFWNCYIDMGPTSDHECIFQRLAGFQSLVTLNLSQSCKEKQFKNGCTLDLRLRMGLGHLERLRYMQELSFEGTMQALGFEEVEWMVEHWKGLRVTSGKHHFEADRDQALKEFLRQHEIVSSKSRSRIFE